MFVLQIRKLAMLNDCYLSDREVKVIEGKVFNTCSLVGKESACSAGDWV